eukprot:GFYU01012392.1.p1 GENE.GFYU01012392.1~~GFYU01012392.1.p1  ORF type:complete len:200 (+),score=67.97 GFYU01012392.1:153-752(+)
MSTQPYALVRASDRHIGVVVDILEENAAWMAEKGIQQWHPGLFRTERMEMLKEQISAGNFFLLIHVKTETETSGDNGGDVTTEDSDVLGVVNFMDEDKEFWDGVLARTDLPVDVNGGAMYMHRMATRLSLRGQGLGGHILSLAKEEAKSRGCRFLRLDCVSNNPVLCEYYSNSGFDFVAETPVPEWGITVRTYQLTVVA